jgi:YfiH family protein
MIQNNVNGLVYYQFESFPSRRVLHGVFTRLGGVSRKPFDSLNLSISVPDDHEAVMENRRRFYAAVGTSRSLAVRTIQVHGTNVAVVGPTDVAVVQSATDGLVTATPNLPLVMAFADCTPIMLYDPIRGAVGIAHAGWRGTVAGICQATVRKMVDSLGCSPADIRGAIGPAIGPCCYEVGPDVIGAVQAAFGEVDALFRPHPAQGDRLYFDQWAANELALRRAGVQQIERADICTACRVDEFYSHRAESGRTGRFGAIIALREA